MSRDEAEGLDERFLRAVERVLPVMPRLAEAARGVAAAVAELARTPALRALLADRRRWLRRQARARARPRPRRPRRQGSRGLYRLSAQERARRGEKRARAGPGARGPSPG